MNRYPTSPDQVLTGSISYRHTQEKITAKTTSFIIDTRTPRKDLHQSVEFSPRIDLQPKISDSRDLQQAQKRIVLLAAEVDRLSTLNYKFVKENELLKNANEQLDRNKDLQNKIGLCLAENEKLNDVLDDLIKQNAKLKKENAEKDEQLEKFKNILDLDPEGNPIEALADEVKKLEKDNEILTKEVIRRKAPVDGTALGSGDSLAKLASADAKVEGIKDFMNDMMKALQEKIKEAEEARKNLAEAKEAILTPVPLKTAATKDQLLLMIQQRDNWVNQLQKEIEQLKRN